MINQKCFSPLAGSLMLESLIVQNYFDMNEFIVSVPLRGV
ncbi:hypothetical protein L8106_16264 [Lyngbya sp. PCC 8106]|nr:hypothetical protein L8106_16264 [Lyngbya sp. PCC 8106]